MLMLMSNTATMHHAKALQRPVYVCAARDEVFTDDPGLAKEFQTLLHTKANHEDTGMRPSVPSNHYIPSQHYPYIPSQHKP